MRVARSVAKILPALALIGFLAGPPATGASAAGGLSVGPNVNVSRLTLNQAETAIAVNPTNPRNTAVASNAAGPGLFEAYSLDGGRTWAGQIIADDDNIGDGCCDPSLAFDDFGNLFFIYLGSGAHDVSAALSTDGGKTFQFLQQVEATNKQADQPTKGGPGVDQPTVTTGPGSVWVNYKLYAKGQYLVANGAEVTGLGEVGRFGPTQQIPGTKPDVFGDIAVGPDGRVAVTYQRYGSRILQGPTPIGLNVDPDGLGPKGFGDKIFVTNTNVGTFDFIGPQSGRSIDAETALAWDNSIGPNTARLYLVYTQERPNESDDTDIVVRISNNGGRDWKPPVRVNDDTGVNSQFNPDIAVDPTTGNVAVSFYDARNDLGTNGLGDVDGVANTDAQYWGAVSRDGGLSFGRNVQISAGTSHVASAGSSVDYGDYIGMAFRAGVFHPAWSDNSNSTLDNPDGTLKQLDVYTAAVTVP